MIQVPFLWTRRAMNQYLQKYFNEVLEALKERGVIMLDANSAGSKRYQARQSANYKYCDISVNYFPDDSFDIFSAAVMRNGWTLNTLFDILQIRNCGFHLDRDGLLRKKGQSIPSPKELADRLYEQAELYEKAVKTLKGSVSIGSLYHKMVTQDGARYQSRLIKLLRKKGLKIHS